MNSESKPSKRELSHQRILDAAAREALLAQYD